jgi:ketosteroid isomerase-like protein
MNKAMITSIAALFLIALGLPPATHAVQADADAAQAVAVVDRFSQELAAGNTSAASALLDEDVVIHESGGVERSRAEYAAHHLAADAQFMRSSTRRLLSRTSGASGDLAWVASETELSRDVEGKPKRSIMTETMVLQRSGEGWRIVHIHWSSRPVQERS